MLANDPLSRNQREREWQREHDPNYRDGYAPDLDRKNEVLLDSKPLPVEPFVPMGPEERLVRLLANFCAPGTGGIGMEPVGWRPSREAAEAFLRQQAAFVYDCVPEDVVESLMDAVYGELA